MSSHAVNLALWFVLELAALLAFAFWGRQKSEGWLRILCALGLPTIVAICGTTLRVLNDPGPAPIAVPGIPRLAFESAPFAVAVLALYGARLTPLYWILGIAVVIHYVTPYDHIVWLIARWRMCRLTNARCVLRAALCQVVAKGGPVTAWNVR
jgi:hypothetical protein